MSSLGIIPPCKRMQFSPCPQGVYKVLEKALLILPSSLIDILFNFYNKTGGRES